MEKPFLGGVGKERIELSCGTHRSTWQLSGNHHIRKYCVSERCVKPAPFFGLRFPAALSL